MNEQPLPKLRYINAKPNNDTLNTVKTTPCDNLSNLNTTHGIKSTEIYKLPIEILQKIASNLDIFIYHNLKNTCKKFRCNMDSNPFLEFEAYKKSNSLPKVYTELTKRFILTG
jgi:hypothetical protein